MRKDSVGTSPEKFSRWKFSRTERFTRKFTSSPIFVSRREKNVAGLGALNFDATDLPFPNWSDLYVRCQREKFTLGFYSTARDPRDKFHVCKNNDVFYEQPLSDVPYSYMCENGHFYQKGLTSFGCQRIWLQMPKSKKHTSFTNPTFPKYDGTNRGSLLVKS